MAQLDYTSIKALVSANNKSTADDTVIIAQAYKESRFDPAGRTSDPNSTATGLLGMTNTAIRETNRVKGTTYTLAQMTTAATAIEAGTTYLQICINRKKTISAALDYYGTGSGYSTNILAASKALAGSATDYMAILVKHIGK
jgi:soluble lytic murein transglycosylase-like protein